MYSKKSTVFTAHIKNRPKVLKLPRRNINSSGNIIGDSTPRFNGEISVRSLWALPKEEKEFIRKPKVLPPLQPLLHSPRVKREFVFKGHSNKTRELLDNFKSFPGFFE